MDPDTIKEMHFEELAYRKWERAEKNRILAMHDPIKKQKAWAQLFPVMTLNDDWLTSNVVDF